jgi:hypothetical protein
MGAGAIPGRILTRQRAEQLSHKFARYFAVSPIKTATFSIKLLMNHCFYSGRTTVTYVRFVVRLGCRSSAGFFNDQKIAQN